MKLSIFAAALLTLLACSKPCRCCSACMLLSVLVQLSVSLYALQPDVVVMFCAHIEECRANDRTTSAANLPVPLLIVMQASSH